MGTASLGSQAPRLGVHRGPLALVRHGGIRPHSRSARHAPLRFAHTPSSWRLAWRGVLTGSLAAKLRARIAFRVDREMAK